MSDLIEDEPTNAPEFTVSEISGAVKRVIEGEFGHVRVRGEVGRVSRPRSGHVYLDLKDDRAVLAGVIWKGVAAGWRPSPRKAIEVVATGRLTTFPGQSRYQIVIEDIRPAGAGRADGHAGEAKKALAAEGLFDEARKRPCPSCRGDRRRDLALGRGDPRYPAPLRDRFPRKVLIWPVAVQGAACAPEVARAIEGFNALTPAARCRARPADRGARRRLGRGSLGLQRGNRGPRGGGQRDPADLGRRARDRHDADRLRLGPARADAHRGRRTRRAGPAATGWAARSRGGRGRPGARRARSSRASRSSRRAAQRETASPACKRCLRALRAPSGPSARPDPTASPAPRGCWRR
jgi:hypothetical protein